MTDRKVNLRQAIGTFRGHHIPNIDFIGRKRIWFALSGFFIVLSLVGLFARGLNFSIAFKGGSLLQFQDKTGASVGTFQGIMGRFGLPDSQVEIVRGGDCPSGCVNIRTRSLTSLGATPRPSPTTVVTSPSVSPQPTGTASPSGGASPTSSPASSPTPTGASPTPTGASPSASVPVTPATGGPLPTFKGDLLRQALARAGGISVNDINEQDVGPTWGGTISRKAVVGLVVFLVLVTLYITFRFELKMAAGALAALAHDLVITAGIYALVGREVTPETVIAVLTILGYSLYDTVVIFDKVKENTESAAMVARDTYSGVVNTSLNQTFMRSVNTSLVVLFPIGALLLFGGQTLKDFAFALFVGVASGTYSSIFVAAPILAMFKEQEPKYQQIRLRAQTRGTRPGLRPAPGVRTAPQGAASRELEPAGAVAGLPTRGAPSPQTARPRPAGARKKKGKPQGKPKRRRR
jgi:preprotein translocase subunit SecF